MKQHRKINKIYKSILLLLFTTLIATFANATTFYADYIQMADSSFKSDNYSQAGLYYDSAFARLKGVFNLNENIKKQLFDASKAWAYAGNKKKAYHYATLAIQNRFYDLYAFFNDKKYKKGVGRNHFNRLISQINIKNKEFNSGINDSLKYILESWQYIDQKLRKIVGKLEDKYPNDSPSNHVPQIKKFWEISDYIDSIKANSLVQIIKQYGWPGINLVGEKANHSAWLIFVHSADSTHLKIITKYLPLLKKSCKKGQSYWKGYAYAADRINAIKCLPEKYCTTTYWDAKKGYFTLKAQNKSCVNYYREQVGITPSFSFRKEDPCKNPDNPR